MRRHRYAVLTAVLLVGLVVQTLDVGARGATLLSDVTRTVLGIAVLFAAFERPAERRAMSVLMVMTLALGWISYFLGRPTPRLIELGQHAGAGVYLWAAALAIVRDLFTRAPEGIENVLGAVCGYLLAADGWGDINAFVYLVAPTTFTVTPDVAPLLDDWRGRVALFTYYSYAQVLTIGYADVTPVRAPATTFSLMAALFGVFYTAVVVSQVVGLAQLAPRQRDDA